MGHAVSKSFAAYQTGATVSSRNTAFRTLVRFLLYFHTLCERDPLSLPDIQLIREASHFIYIGRFRVRSFRLHLVLMGVPCSSWVPFTVNREPVLVRSPPFIVCQGC